MAWAGADGTVWCGPARFGDTATAAAGSVCTTFARLHPGGITIVLTPAGPSGASVTPFTVKVPVNAGYCNPDDRFAAIADGCTTGFAHTLAVAIGTPAAGAEPVMVPVTVTVVRTATPGQLLTSPAHGWRIDPPQSFA
ncbi:MAG TPA: hypothetical protein DCR14_09885 [Acidimicrobiaceae bacterium]|nr:hypothetical protein [Acidimicrobiaceae bacterium]